MGERLWKLRDEKGRHIGYRIAYRDEKGRRRTKRFPGASIEDARKLRDALQRKAWFQEHGLERVADTLTLGEWAETWFERRAAGECSEATHAKNREVYDAHIKRDLGSLPLARLTQGEVATWVARLRSRLKRSGRDGAHTVHAAERLLAQLHRAACEEGHFGEKLALEAAMPGRSVKPWRGTKAPKPKSRPELFGEADFARVMAAAREEGGARIEAALALALFCGHRRAEARGLRWGVHVRPAPPALRAPVDVAADVPLTEVLLGQWTKGRKERYGLLAGDAAAVLDRYRAEQRAIGLGNDGEHVFCHETPMRLRGRVVVPRGAPITQYVLRWEVWDRIRERALLPSGFRPHDLRGALAKELQRRGLTVREIADVLGQEDVATTAIYLMGAASPSVLKGARTLAAFKLDAPCEVG